MGEYLAVRCPKCGNQFPTYFEKCIYCGTDLRGTVHTEYEPLDTTPMYIRPKERPRTPRIKKWKGYEKIVMDATPKES